MIESAAKCLKQGGRCPWHLLKKSLPTQRYLHSTFWSHGASEINLPAWWIMLLRSSQEQEPRWASRRLAAAQKILSYVAQVGFVGFLYPSRTLAIVQQIVNRDRARLKSRQGIRYAPNTSRTFSSIISDSKNTTGDVESATARAGSLPSAEVEEPASKPSLEYYSDRTEVDLQLAELFQSLGKHGPDHEKAWHFYQNLQHLSEDLTSQQLRDMIRYLSHGATPLSSERVIFLVEKIPFCERDEFHHKSAIRAALNRNSLELAMDFHRESLRQTLYSGGASLILRYTIDHEEWHKAIETLNDYFYERCRHKKLKLNDLAMWEYTDRSSIWRHVHILPFSRLCKKAAAAMIFAEKSTTPTVTARRFALEVITEAFSVQIDSFIKVNAHKKLFNTAWKLRKGLETQMSFLYNRAIWQLSFHKVKTHQKIALEFYRRVKEEKWVPEFQVLDFVLTGFCDGGHLTDIFQVIDDVRRHHGRIPSPWILRIIPVLSRHGEAESVHELFREYMEYGGKHPEFLFDHILHLHHRRAEPHHAVEFFNDIQEKYDFVPNISSWNWVVAVHTRVGDVEGATTWVDRLVEAGQQPNARTYTYMMQMYAKRGDLEAVQRLFRQSEAAGIEPDPSMIASLVLVLVKNDMLDDAKKVVEDALRIKSKQSRTRMWNYLMVGYAHRGDIVRVKEINQRMREAGVPADADTYSALMHSLIRRRLPHLAEKIMFRILPRAGIRPDSVHYATLMAGFFERGSYWKVLIIYRLMLKRNIAPTQSTQSVLLRAIAALESQSKVGGEEQPKELGSTLPLFKQIVANMDPAELAPKRQVPFVGPNRLDEAFTSISFAHLMSVYGREAAFDRVRELYDLYLGTAMKFQGTIDFIPPIELLSALLSANAEARDYREVDRCWHLAVEKAQKLASPSDAVDGKPWRALYSRRFLLNLPLPIYMKSLETQDKIDHITTTIESLLGLGFEFHNNTWNTYVKILARSGREKLAFSVCERELMSEWFGWETLGHRLNLQRKFELIKPDGVRPTQRFPGYATLVYMAAAYVKTRSEGVQAVQQLARVAPRTINAVVKMPQMDDEIQANILGDGGDGGDGEDRLY